MELLNGNCAPRPTVVKSPSNYTRNITKIINATGQQHLQTRTWSMVWVLGWGAELVCFCYFTGARIPLGLLL
eukprot:810082-Amphidinium_carterae.2